MSKEHEHIYASNVKCKICKETFDRAGKWCKSTSEIYLKDYTPNRDCQKHINAFTKSKDK